MRKTFYLSSLCLGLSLFSISSYADVTAQNGFYIDVNGGYSGLFSPRQPTNLINATPVGTYKVTNTTWSSSFGYQWALDSFSTTGWELGYSQDGKATYTGSGSVGDTGSLKLSASSIDMLATFNTMWSNGFNVFIKGGVAWQWQKANLDGPLSINGVSRSTDSFTNKHFAPMAEMGLGYMVTNNLNVYTSVSGIFGDSENNWAFSNAGTDYNNPFAVYRFRIGLSYLF
ncbi:MAG: hypothetical protein K0S29_34 [Gammaproteobacteria bacterium]|jgi:hypothetical protein|nr:hypothetical protein [Gammaproteobacteria bacterium]